MKRRSGFTLGIVLVVAGGYLLVERFWSFSGPGAILGLIGISFLAISAARGFTGPLLPGGVLTGLAAGFLFEDRLSPWMPGWGAIVLGLGLGFLFVGIVDRVVSRERRPSPVPPGIVLTAIGLGSLAARSLSIRWLPGVDLARLWPWAILLAGVILIVRALLNR